MGKQTLTKYRPLLTRRSLVPVAFVVAVVVLAISPRSLLAPAHSFERAAESKRPKAPKNVVRTGSHHVTNTERPGKAPRPGPTGDTFQETHDLQARVAFASAVRTRAFHELTKPDYLKAFNASPPGNRLPPPA